MNIHHGVGSETARVRVSTALGEFDVEASGRGLRSVTPVRAVDRERAAPHATGRGGPDDQAAPLHVRVAADALRRYAEGGRARYEGALDIPAPAFHLAVWERLRAIPFGATATYGEIAAKLGMPGEARAVGAAIAANPVCILVPCHRIVGADGSLRGFAWGLDLKRRLLAHEGSAALSLFAGVQDGKGTGRPVRPD